mgnify:FL=1
MKNLNFISHVLQVRIEVFLRIFAMVIALLTLSTVVIDFGFSLSAEEKNIAMRIYNFSWWFYFIVFTVRLGIFFYKFRKASAGLTILTGLLIYLTLLPRMFSVSPDGLLYSVWWFLGHLKTTIFVISVFAVLDLSKSIISFLNRKTNPALMMATGFAVIIFIGGLLLLLPRSIAAGANLSVVDAFFVSTSAVCVTGLSPVDISTTFTIDGQLIILALIQIGGLGVMTITSFFALFYMGNTNLYSQLAVKNMIGTDTWNSLLSTLFYILGFTFAIEMIGAAFIWLSVHSTLGMTMQEEVYFAIFHSISAFCNAGFSTLSNNLGNPSFMGINSLYVIISVLVILGGIGFPILMNLKCALFYNVRRLFNKDYRQYLRVTTINTKIVLATTTVLLVLSTVAFALIEWNGAFAGMTTWEKIVQSFFHASVPRTAGFNSVDMGSFSNIGILVFMILMWIGGASQSTAGGIKVNTIAVAWANFMSVIRERKSVVVLKREVSQESVQRATATVFVFILVILLAFIILLATEPGLTPKQLLFEVVSAVGTVGSSLNATAYLTPAGKIIVSLLMFVGRVGLIVVAMSFVKKKGQERFSYLKDNVIIN